MTPAMVDLLKRLIQNERRYWLKMEEYHKTKHSADYPVNNIRGEEVGWINGLNPRTVASLEKLGLVESLDMGNGMTYVFLASYEAMKPAEELFK